MKRIKKLGQIYTKNIIKPNPGDMAAVFTVDMYSGRIFVTAIRGIVVKKYAKHSLLDLGLYKESFLNTELMKIKTKN